MGDEKKTNMDIEVQLALEERKIVQDIIHQQEDMSFKIRGWAIAIFIAITVVYIRVDDSSHRMEGWVYFIVILFSSYMFHSIERRHMELFFKLKKRSGRVEDFLSGKVSTYQFGIQDGIDESLLVDDGKGRFTEIFLVYTLLVLLAFLISKLYASMPCFGS